MLTDYIIDPSSYRDPSGFVFKKDNIVYRQVNQVFREHFDLFINSGLYKKLVDEKLLIPHEVINENLTGTSEWYTTLKPETISFISYPWEWSFDMLKDAALLTLRVAREAIAAGMVLKDATAFNIQWHKGNLIFIDSLSFEKYDPEQPWIAYRQFCESFLAPLLLMHHRKNALQELLLAYPNGIPLPVAKSLLPASTRFSLHTYLHVHLHAKVMLAKNKQRNTIKKFSKHKFLNLLTSLEIVIKKTKLAQHSSAWSDYYEEANQRNDYVEQKQKIITNWLNDLREIKFAVDLGANNGVFSQLLASKNISTLAVDFDPYCINNLYNLVSKEDQKKIQPLITDLANPSPAIGLNNQERSSFISRLNADLALALALVHHLVIGKNIPLESIAGFFGSITKALIIEFIPKQDEKIRLMLHNKKDIYTQYSQENFEKAFARYFKIEKKEPVVNSGRVLYLMIRHEQ